MRPKIALDIDGPCYDYHGTTRYLLNAHRGCNLPPVEEFWTDWDALSEWVAPADEAWLWSEGIELGLFRYGHVIKGAVDGVRALADIGDVVPVTHRPPAAVGDTLRFLAYLDLPLSGVHLLTKQEPKSSVEADLYIDDGAHVIHEVRNSRPQAACVLFSRPWNRDAWFPAIGASLPSPTPEPYRAESWDEVVEEAKRLFVKDWRSSEAYL